jgi:hypothetical protein
MTWDGRTWGREDVGRTDVGRENLRASILWGRGATLGE